MKFNPSFAELIFNCRQSFLPKRREKGRLISWEEDHRLRSGPSKAIVFILPTIGCSWALSRSGGCSVCGYIYDNPQEPDYDQLVVSFKQKLKELIKNEECSVKLFTSGSILDSKELPTEHLITILQELNDYPQISEIVLESRPEYITEKVLDTIADIVDINKIEIAIGLESANDEILRKSINKGFLWKDFERASSYVLSKGGKIKAYLLFKPPFLSEYDSILDTEKSVEKIAAFDIDTVSINAISIHRGTYLSTLFESKTYRPPYLWSLLYLCKELKTKYPNIRFICQPVAGGKEKGAHNCGVCDSEIITKLHNFTMSQDLKDLEGEIDCPCEYEWKSRLVYEKLSLTDYTLFS